MKIHLLAILIYKHNNNSQFRNKNINLQIDPHKNICLVREINGIFFLIIKKIIFIYKAINQL